MVHLDEHARLGAMLITIPDLAKREEDLSSVLAVTLYNFSKDCKTWKPPTGLTKEAWDLIASCVWRGNTRTLIRVIETAAVKHGTRRKGELLGADEIREGLDLWEPEEHPDIGMYVSA